MSGGDGAAGTRPGHPLRGTIAFGSNLGDRELGIRSALRSLASDPGIELIAVSDVIETVAVTLAGPDPDAPRYLNGVAIIETILSPLELLDALQRVESAHGRIRTTRWGDRTLDLDIVDLAGIELSHLRLELPHPRAHERDFVLAPWSRLDPGAILTGHGPVAELLDALLRAPGGGRASASSDSLGVSP